MTIRTIGVVGAGQMGYGIAHVSAGSGIDVVLCDVEDRFLDNARETVDAGWLGRKHGKGFSDSTAAPGRP